MPVRDDEDGALAQLAVRRVGFTDRLQFALWASGFGVDVQLGWGEPSLRYDVAKQTRWLCMAFTAVSPAYARTIDAVIVRAQPVDVAYGHSIVTAAAGPSSGGPLSFVTRAGAACATATPLAVGATLTARAAAIPQA